MAIYKGDLILTGSPGAGLIPRGSLVEGSLLDEDGKVIAELNVEVK